MSAVAILTTVICVLSPTETAKILVIPIPLESVFRLGLQIGQASLDSGHEVWIIGNERHKMDAIKKGFHYLTYDTFHMDTFENKAAINVAETMAHPDSHSKPGLLQFMGIAKDMNFQMCNQTLSNKALINKIREQNFDLAVMGTIVFMDCMYLIAYKFDIPYVTYEPMDEPWIAGVTALPSMQPLMMADPPLSNKMSFAERMQNTLLHFVFPLAINYILNADYASWFVPEKPPRSFNELRSMSMMFFIVLDNTCLDYPRLSAPNYRFVGALTQEEASPLKGALKEFVDGARDGLILVTFGSSKLGGETLRHLLPILRKVVPEIRQKVLLQMTIDDDPEEFPSNIRFERWIPQNDILGHPNTVTMVSHGGANGQMEATYHGVPQVCIGIQEEEKYNCRRMAEHHYGLSLPLDTLSAEDLLQAITQITKDPGYKGNVSHCSRIMHSLPRGKQQLAFWIDHVLEFGEDHLRPSSADMPFYSLYMLDILAAVLLLLVLVVGGLLACLKCMCRRAKIASKVKEDWFTRHDKQHLAFRMAHVLEFGVTTCARFLLICRSTRSISSKCWWLHFPSML